MQTPWRNKTNTGSGNLASFLSLPAAGYRFVAGLIFVLLMSLSVHGQTVSGTVTGTITDPSGAIVPAATVTVKNTDTGDTRTGVSNSAGLYSIPALPPGSYVLDAVVKGFKEETSSLTVAPGQVLSVNLKLVVGASSDKVEVFSSDSLGLQTETHELSSVMSAEVLEDTPQYAGYRGDTFYAQSTEVGVQPGSALGANNLNSNVSQYNAQSNTLLIGGAGFWSASYLEDGVVDMSYFAQQATVQPPSEAVESTEVIRNAANARYDGANVVNVVTKSGSNEFHGRLYDYVQNNVFNAKGEIAPAKVPHIRVNKFGINAGWVVPFTRHKLFFFVDYQGFRSLSGSTLNDYLPTAAEKSGDFSADLVDNTQYGNGGTAYGTTIYDPTTFNATLTPTGGKAALQAFPNNKIPAGRISPLALAYLKMVYPDPNYLSTSGTNNYASTHQVTQFTHDDYLYRLDYNVSDKDHLYTAWNSNNPNIIRPEFVEDCICKEPNQLFGKDFYIEWSHAFKSNVVNIGRAAYARSFTGQQFGQISNGTNYFGQLGLTGLSPAPQLWGWPGLNVGGYSGPSGSPLTAKQNMFEYSDEINWTHGKHQTFIGGEFDIVDYNATWYTGSPNGGISANGQYTYNGLNGVVNPKLATPAWQNSGQWVTKGGNVPSANQLADYLLGYYSGTSASAGSQIGYFHQNNIMPYIQDDWRILKNLTLNLGLRYDRFTVPIEQFGHAGYLTPETGKFTEAGWLPNRYDFSPRVGAAYALNDRTTIHGGGGIYFYQFGYYDLVNYTADPLYNTALNATQTQATPVIWPSTSAGPNPNTGAAPGQQEILTLGNIETIWSQMPAATGVFAPGASTFSKKMPTSYSEQWNLAIQRTVGKDFIAQIDYIGSSSHHILNYGNINLASLPTAANVNPTSSADINSRRPYQSVQGNIIQFSKRGASNYHGLEVQIKKRFVSGFSVNTNFVWQKSMDFQDSDHKSTGEAGAIPQVDYGLSDFTQKYVYKLSGIYELPFGKGKRFLNGGNWFENQLGGWRISGYMSVNAGPPINTAANDNSNTGGGIQMRGNRYCDPNAGAPHNGHGMWFNTACFIPAGTNGQPASNTFGNERRNDIFGPRNTNMDLSAFKEFELHDRLKMQFRTDAFSALNHPLPQEPNNTISSAQFGQITGWGGARSLQMSLKVLW